jgi:hypothetical protein
MAPRPQFVSANPNNVLDLSPVKMVSVAWKSSTTKGHHRNKGHNSENLPWFKPQ